MVGYHFKRGPGGTKALRHPEINLPGYFRLSYQRPPDGSRLDYWCGGIIPADRVEELARIWVSSKDIEVKVKAELEKYDGNAFSVDPWIARQRTPSQLGVTIYRVSE